MGKQKVEFKDLMVVGFALFAMFFGAGNLIFPPYLGVESGSSWFTGFAGFLFADGGLALLAVIAATRFKGDTSKMFDRAGHKLSILLGSAIVICIGPLLAIPRTAATTYEMGILPTIGPGFNAILFSVIFFALTLVLTIKPSKVVDIVGQFLTPALLIALAILIVKGVITPLGEIRPDTLVPSVFAEGVNQGYQTMDTLAATVFSTIVIVSIMEKGYDDEKLMVKATIGAGAIAVIGMGLVYGGLCYVGATVSTQYGIDVEQTALIVAITEALLGQTGKILLAIIVALACLTTSIGLLTTGSTFFEKVTNGKLSYKFNAIAISLMSYIIACQGVDKIVKLSVPILNVLYPVAITLIAVTMFNKFLTNVIAVRFAVYASLIFGVLFQLFGSSLNFMPLANIGFGWVLPTVIALGIGYFIKENK